MDRTILKPDRFKLAKMTTNKRPIGFWMLLKVGMTKPEIQGNVDPIEK